MKIQYRTVLGSGTGKTFEEIGNAPCCKSMSEAYDDGPIEFADEREPCKHSDTPVLALRDYEFDYYGDRDSVYYPISLCPFCGTKIECEEVERVRVIETKHTEMRPEIRTETRREVEWRKES